MKEFLFTNFSNLGDWYQHSRFTLFDMNPSDTLERIQDFAKEGSNQARGSGGKFLNLERPRHHFLGFQGEFETKKGFRPNPSNPP